MKNIFETETKAILYSIIKDYKTIASKKGFLTKEKNFCQEALNDIEAIINRSVSANHHYYLGEKITKARIARLKGEILICDLIIKELKTMKNQGLKKPTVRGLKTVCSQVIKATGLKVDGTLKKGYKYVAGGKIVKTSATPCKAKKVCAKKMVAKKKPVAKKKTTTRKTTAKTKK